jgi:hypothetical protein
MLNLIDCGGRQTLLFSSSNLGGCSEGVHRHLQKPQVKNLSAYPHIKNAPDHPRYAEWLLYPIKMDGGTFISDISHSA